jgi:hypothetical protein
MSEHEHESIQETLHENDNLCFEQLKMIKRVFLKSCSVLELNYSLKITKGLIISEEVKIFLYIYVRPTDLSLHS